MMEKKITKREVQERIKGLDEATQRNMVCAMVGHSRIVSLGFLGYVYCARCGDQIGDTLAGIFDTSKSVVMHHNCDTCRANYEECDWRDKLMTPDPFTEPEAKDAA